MHGGHRISEKADAEKLLAECRKEMVSTIQKITRKEKAENPPPLYDLTTLQRDANRLLGFTAQQTLNYAQSLYEKKLITYPRTNSRFLTEDMAASLPGLMSAAAGAFDVHEAVPVHAEQAINNSKVGGLMPQNRLSAPEPPCRTFPGQKQQWRLLVPPSWQVSGSLLCRLPKADHTGRKKAGNS